MCFFALSDEEVAVVVVVVVVVGESVSSGGSGGGGSTAVLVAAGGELVAKGEELSLEPVDWFADFAASDTSLVLVEISSCRNCSDVRSLSSKNVRIRSRKNRFPGFSIEVIREPFRKTTSLRAGHSTMESMTVAAKAAAPTPTPFVIPPSR